MTQDVIYDLFSDDDAADRAGSRVEMQSGGGAGLTVGETVILLTPPRHVY